MAHRLQGISEVSRARDWRHSFIPFIIGCVYLWIRHFYLPFDGPTLLMLLLSLMTTVGFASLGYFINEYFDREQDALAGKINRLILVPHVLRMALLVIIILLTFLPWVWLPTDQVTWILIAVELSLFLAYSLPYPRLKSVPVVSNLIDMSYAYLLPLLLSFHTYALYIGEQHPIWIFPLMTAVVLIGFRNIVIHQINDLFNDRRAGLPTLPQILGPANTGRMLVGLLSLEVLSFLTFGAMLADGSLRMLVVTVLFVIFLLVRILQLRKSSDMRFLPLEPFRHLTDPYYQITFPALLLLLLVFRDWRWAMLIPFHALILVPPYVMKDTWLIILSLRPKLMAVWWSAISFFRLLASGCVNYPIYWIFRMVGVNLIKERKSGLEYLRSRFS